MDKFISRWNMPARYNLFVNILPFVLLFAVGLLFFTSFSLHYEYTGDAMFVQLFRGTLMGLKLYNFYFYEIGWSYLFTYLYEVIPAVPWYGISIVFLTASTFFLLLYLLWRVLSANEATALVSVVFVLAFILWSRNFFWMSFSRLPIIACGLTLIYMAIQCTYNPNFKLKSVHYLTFLCYFVMNACFRPESAALATIMTLLAVIVFYKDKGKPILQKYLLLVLPLIVSLAVLSLNQFITRSEDHAAMKRMIALHFDFYDAGKVNYSFMSSGTQDSMKLEAMLREFTPEKQQFSLKEYERFLSGRLLTISTLFEWKWRLRNVWEFSQNLIQTHKYWLLTYLFMLLIILFLTKHFKDKFRMLLVQMMLILMILGIVFFIKPAERVYEPMLALSGFLLLFNFLQVPKSDYSKKIRTILSFTAIIVGVLLVYNTYRWFSVRNRHDSETEKLHAGILSDLYLRMMEQGKVVVFTAPAFELFIMHPLREFRIPAGYAIWTYDTHLTYLPGYDAQLEKLCGGTSLVDFYSTLSTLGQKALIVANPGRMQLISDYSSLLDQFRIEYENYPDRDLPFDLKRNKEELSYYYIKKASPKISNNP